MNGRPDHAGRSAVAGILPMLLVVAGCAGGPPVPAWQGQAHAALAAYTEATLGGQGRVAELELARAREAVSRTGRADLMARVELTRCALAQATLHADDCPAFAALAGAATDAERAYADYLRGRWPPPHAERLPAAARAMVTAAAPNNVLASIDDPVSRLVAAGTVLRRGQLSSDGIATAIDTATQQGWRAALLAWLTFERERRARLGDSDGVRALDARIDLVGGGH